MAIDDQKHRSALTVHQVLEELNEHLRTHAAFDDMNRSAPRGLIAEIIFRLKRCP